MKKLVILLTVVILFSSCVTKPQEIDESLNPAELFQLAQAASESKNYDTAINYYEVFIRNYSDDIQRLVEAEYEIAFITYKQGDKNRAKNLFTSLLKRYEGDGSQVLPAWPMVLSQKLLKK